MVMFLLPELRNAVYRVGISSLERLPSGRDHNINGGGRRRGKPMLLPASGICLFVIYDALPNGRCRRDRDERLERE